MLEPLHDRAAGRALAAERALVASLGGGCQLPLGAVAEERDGMLHLSAVVASIDGTRQISQSMSGLPADPEQLGRDLAEALAADGAKALLDNAGSS